MSRAGGPPCPPPRTTDHGHRLLLPLPRAALHHPRLDLLLGALPRHDHVQIPVLRHRLRLALRTGSRATFELRRRRRREGGFRGPPVVRPWPGLRQSQGCARGRVGVKSGSSSGYWRLERVSGRAGGCTAVGGRWEVDSGGWGGNDRRSRKGRGYTAPFNRRPGQGSF